MGIKHLNQYLLDHCCQDISVVEPFAPRIQPCTLATTSSISKQTLDVLRNRTVVVDTSIYIYKFLTQGALIENFYTMISLFREYEITPLFIFDGKPPPEKGAVLNRRNQIRKTAEHKLATIDWTEDVDVSKITQWKKQCTRLRKDDILQIKQLMNAYGVAYYDAAGEADQVCAYMVLSGKAWACISDDMDMFVYGCPRVLRHLNLLHATVLLYETDQILKDIQMPLDTFRQIMVLSGTDYTTHEPLHLKETLQLYQEYRTMSRKTQTFYDWIRETRQTYSINYDCLLDTCEMFCLPAQWPELDDLVITKRTPDRATLRNITRRDGFIYVD